MKKTILVILLALLLLCAAAYAEEAEFVQGGGAAKSGGEYYMRVDEGETDALVRIDADGVPHIAVRAAEIGDMVEMDGVLYCLMRDGDVWRIMGFSDGGAFTAYEFASGVSAGELGARDGTLFLLADDRLHILYLQQGLCLQLAGARMDEYALHGDYAYYISLDNAMEHTLADAAGNVASVSAGALCRVNMSTGKTEVIGPEGAADLSYAGGKLYFHSYAFRYLMGAGDGLTLEGHLCSYDIGTGETAQLTDDYDWDYAAGSFGVYALRQDGLIWLSDMQVMAMLPDNVQIESAGDAVLCYDPEEMSFSIVK